MNKKLIIIFWLGFICNYVYAVNTCYQAYTAYNNLQGIVIDTYQSNYKNLSTNIITIELSTGEIGQINYGHRNIAIGSKYINKISGYSFLFGIWGSAYSIQNSSWYNNPVLISLIYILFITPICVCLNDTKHFPIKKKRI